jgi:hypothetical protein
MALIKCHECGAEVSNAAAACPKCGAAPRKKSSSLVLVLGALLLFGLLISFMGKSPEAPKATGNEARQPTPGEKAEAAHLHRLEVESCNSGIDAQKREYARLMAAGKPWEAAAAIRGCAHVLEDAALKEMVASAEQKGLVAVINNAKAPAAERVSAIERLSREYPEKGEPFQKLLTQLQAKAEEGLKAEQKKQAAAEAARRKREGVSIGMTKDEVRASSWGRPQNINTSVYRFGTHEQWVYGGGNYLYFENGVLTSIQTGR